MTAFQRDRFPTLRRDQWREVESFFAEKPRAVMPHELVNRTSLDRAEALALLACLAADFHHVTMYLLVYHRGCSDAPFDKRRVEDGWPSFPITCSFCNEPIGRDDLSYQLMARIDGELPRFEED